MKLSGIKIAVLELYLFYRVSFSLRENDYILSLLNPVSYYWLMFTILTGIWEATFVTHRYYVKKSAKRLLRKKQHVWTNEYTLSTILPWNLSKKFYSEYGAYADREYMSVNNPWSFVIEGTHAVFCGSMAALSIYSRSCHHIRLSNVQIAISMGTQLMNSILYMAEYYIQMKSPTSVNYDTPNFPVGKLCCKRPFMYINLFWTVMPLYVLGRLIQ